MSKVILSTDNDQQTLETVLVCKEQRLFKKHIASDDDHKEYLSPDEISYDVLTNDTYFGIIMEWLTPREYVKSLALVSKYHYYFIKHSNNDIIIQRIFCREFGHRLNNLFFLQPSVAYQAISLCYNTWNDDTFLTHKLFKKLQNENEFSAQHTILDRLQAEHFMVRMHIFRPTLYILKYWFHQLAQSFDTDLQSLGFDTETSNFIPLQIDETPNDSDISEQTINHIMILSSHHVEMNPKKVHFSAAVLSVCMARVPSIFNAEYFREFLQYVSDINFSFIFLSFVMGCLISVKQMAER